MGAPQSHSGEPQLACGDMHISASCSARLCVYCRPSSSPRMLSPEIGAGLRSASTCANAGILAGSDACSSLKLASTEEVTIAEDAGGMDGGSANGSSADGGPPPVGVLPAGDGSEPEAWLGYSGDLAAAGAAGARSDPKSNAAGNDACCGISCGVCPGVV